MIYRAAARRSPEEDRKAAGWARLIELFALAAKSASIEDSWGNAGRVIVRGRGMSSFFIDFEIEASTGLEGLIIGRENHAERDFETHPWQIYLPLTDAYLAVKDGAPDEMLPSWSWYDGLTKTSRTQLDIGVRALLKGMSKDSAQETAFSI